MQEGGPPKVPLEALEEDAPLVAPIRPRAVSSCLKAEEVRVSGIVERDRERRDSRARRLEQELARALEVLKGLEGVERVILFGSLASLDTGAASDIDLIVVRRTEKRFLDRLDDVIREVQPRVGMDFLVYTPEEFALLSEERDFVRRAVREGKVLYAAQR